MKQQTNIRIATPCHEDWNAMTPAEGGKFCSSCSKSVVDFTLMSDAQILKFLSAHNSGLCGRFDAGQLERPLTEPAVSKKKSWYLALALPLTLFFQKSFGQKGIRTMGAPAIKVEQKVAEVQEVVVGQLVVPPVVSEWIAVHGFLTDETGKPVESASIFVKGTSQGSTTDSTGSFSLKLRRKEYPMTLTASAVGYHTLEKKITLANADEMQMLILNAAPMMLGDVSVTSYPSVGCRVIMGGAIGYRTITRKEKRDSAMRKVLHLSPFMVYPNPAQSSSIIHLNFKKASAYEVQLLNNASALLKTEMMQVSSDNTPMPFQLPKSPAGIYYLRLISDDKKQPYLEKILVN